MPRGGFRETARGKVGRPISPAILQDKIAALSAALKRSGVERWTDQELYAVHQAIQMVAGTIANEIEGRAERESQYDESLTYDEFAALLGVSKQRVEQLVRCGRLARPLTHEMAEAYRRGTPEAPAQAAVLTALTSEWQSAAAIAKQAGLLITTVRGVLAKFQKQGKAERREGPIAPANNQPTVEWRRPD